MSDEDELPEGPVLLIEPALFLVVVMVAAAIGFLLGLAVMAAATGP